MTDDRSFTLVRTLPTTPDRVWRAWTDPAVMSQWMHPSGVVTPRESVSAEPVVGGRYKYTMVNEATGKEYPTGGRYLELDEPRRLVCTWGAPDADVQTTPRVSVDLEAYDGGTRMTFTCGIVAGPGDEIYDGWAEALDNLETVLQ